MKAVLMTAPGTPDVLQVQEVPEPEITSAQQIKVRIKAAGINPVDTKIRAMAMYFPDNLPCILGCDGAGIVEAIGSEVSRFQPGDEVWFSHGGLGGEPGNYAEFTVLDESIAQHKPKSLSFAQASAAPLVYITAWEVLFHHANLQAGQTILIHAGAGGMGQALIQLAKQAGAKVITTISTAEKAAIVQALRADEIINYKQQDVLEAVLKWTQGKGVEVAVDTVGAEVFKQTIPMMAYYGKLITLLDPGPQVDWKNARYKNLQISFELMSTPMVEDLPDALNKHGEILRQCGQWFDEGKLNINIQQSLPLEQAKEAHHLIEQGHAQGKLVLTME